MRALGRALLGGSDSVSATKTAGSQIDVEDVKYEADVNYAGDTDSEDVVDIGELLDGSVSSVWFEKDRRIKRRKQGRSQLLAAEGGPRLQRAWFSGRPWAHGCWIPMPLLDELDAIERETRDLPMEGDPGPKASAWLERVDDWVFQLELWFRGTSPSVQQSWRNNIDEWEKLLRVLPPKRRNRVLRLIKEGARLPWDGAPPKHLRDKVTGGCPPNHPRLVEQKDKVWESLYKQLKEQAVAPWDCQGRDDVEVLPKGMYPINWQLKAGSDEVRITSNMRPLKERLCEAYCKGVDLPSVHGCRLQHEQDDWVVDFDLHSSYFHGGYHKSAFTWLGFSLSDDELPQAAIDYLWELCPEARFRDRWVFVYHSYAMGAPPSVSDFQEIMSAVVDACKASGVGAAVGGRIEAWKGFIFIDDVKASAKGGPKCGLRNGSGFGAAVELGLQLMAQLLALGCFVNFPKKTHLLPRQRDSVFLGIGHNSIAMRFFLPKKRIKKLLAALRELRRVARVGGKVAAKLVARVIGILWSVQVCCHRAVAVMTRAIIQTIAVMLGKPELRYSVGCPNFRWLLKQAWKGDVVWTQAADLCLTFYLWVPWHKVWAPFGYDTFVECIKDYVRYARVGELSSSCVTVASDASEVAVGGGCFTPRGDGDFECAFFAHHMLRIKTKKCSSARRELEGITETIVALEGAGKLPFGSRVIPVVDNEAVERILIKGSGVPELRELSDFLFFFCILRGILVFPVWQRRSTTIMTICDAGSRIVDSSAYSAHQDLFWGANDLAIRIWGHGFTFDRFGSSSQVQPVTPS